ncbi:hypothetical protein [Hymenobacter arizonensis]|uniref:Uncharacterized protein n=1 Tax=Hymenobacter arizonensis TaxID=1227077 RepID=A0A1I6BFT7_HYMAR|nr:hypothetical protein [Hymenobacter arizonensis]SFQ79771.1 hypothetical protein SAMN04515668_4497 [Hymenobacter arizonensis]
MARCLFAHLETDVIQPYFIGPLAPYFAQQLVDHQDDAIDALTEIEAAPLACSPAAYRLVTRVAAGNKVAPEVYEATEPGPHERPHSAGLEQARAAIPGRLPALRDARGEPNSYRGPEIPFFPAFPFSAHAGRFSPLLHALPAPVSRQQFAARQLLVAEPNHSTGGFSFGNLTFIPDEN